MYAKLSKCEFYRDRIQYLGHIISEEGISVDPEKIEAIMNWPTPRNVIDVRSFMGRAGYYKGFIEGSSKVAHSITYFQKKGIKFEWTPRCEETFQQLKNLLTSAPALKIVDPEKYFVVCTDACSQGLGGVLMQGNHVVCYELRKLKDHENNYATHDLELAAIVHAFKMWMHYLMGRKFELRIDHCSLKYLFDQPTLNAKQARWLDFLCEFDFEIKHIKGKENKVVDALRRKVHEMYVASLSIFQPDLRERIVNHTTENEMDVQIKDKFQQ